jgi:uncharacterized membrane protein YjjP (DUF1212 family)
MYLSNDQWLAIFVGCYLLGALILAWDVSNSKKLHENPAVQSLGPFIVSIIATLLISIWPLFALLALFNSIFTFKDE